MNKKKGTWSKKRRANIDDDDNGKSNKKRRSQRMSSKPDDKSADDATPRKDRIGNDNDELLEEDLEDETLFDLMGDEGEDSDSDSEDDGDDDDGQDASSSSRNNRSKNYFCTRKSEPYCQQNGLPPGSQEIIDDFTSDMNAKLGNTAFKRHARLNWSTDVEAKAEYENIWRELMEVIGDLIGKLERKSEELDVSWCDPKIALPQTYIDGELPVSMFMHFCPQELCNTTLGGAHPALYRNADGRIHSQTWRMKSEAIGLVAYNKVVKANIDPFNYDYRTRVIDVFKRADLVKLI